MNQIELVTALPDWRWKEHSQNEILMTGRELVDISDFVWRIGDVAIAGFMHRSYTSPPWMWFVLAQDVRIADLIDFRRLALLIPKGTQTAVDSAFAVGIKFAKIYGFVDTGEQLEGYDKPYTLMRKI